MQRFVASEFGEFVLDLQLFTLELQELLLVGGGMMLSLFDFPLQSFVTALKFDNMTL
jgi:hypothetical protein